MSHSENKIESALSSIEECKVGLDSVEKSIEILERYHIEEMSAELSDLEKAKLNVGLAYCLASLMYVSLRARVI